MKKGIVFHETAKATGGPIKHICVVCSMLQLDNPPTEAVCFPFSKFRTGFFFCEKHAHEIRTIPGKLTEFENLAGI
jgi:hypothetical protein